MASFTPRRQCSLGGLLESSSNHLCDTGGMDNNLKKSYERFPVCNDMCAMI